MNIQDYANLPENQDGFFVERWRKNRYFVYHRSWSVFGYSISVAKEQLREIASNPVRHRNRQHQEDFEYIEHISVAVPLADGSSEIQVFPHRRFTRGLRFEGMAIPMRGQMIERPMKLFGIS